MIPLTSILSPQRGEADRSFNVGLGASPFLRERVGEGFGQ